VFTLSLAGCPTDFPDRKIVDLGGPCRSSWECNPGNEQAAICYEGVCTLKSKVVKVREAASVKQSLATAEVPTGDTLPEGLFTRIRSAESKGGAIAQCADNEWLTGGSCSPTSAGDLLRESYPQVGADNSTRSGRWVCKVANPDVTVTAFAICATARSAIAEQAISIDAGPAAN